MKQAYVEWSNLVALLVITDSVGDFGMKVAHVYRISGFNLEFLKNGPMAHPGCKRGPFLDNIAPMVQHASDWLQINYSTTTTSRTPPRSHP